MSKKRKTKKEEYLPEVKPADPKKSNHDYLDYGGGADPWHNENSRPHRRYGG